MPVAKKLPIADIMERVQDSIAVRRGADRVPENPLEEQLDKHLEEAQRFRRVVLPPDTRVAPAKRLVLRVMKVYTRYLEIFNYNIVEFLFKLNSKVNYLASRHERQGLENAEAIARLAGSVEEIKRIVPGARVEPHPAEESNGAVCEPVTALLSDLSGCRTFLDLCCGRGTLLEALGQAGIQARGVDPSPEMVARCSEKGLKAIVGDPVAFLQTSKEQWDAIHGVHFFEDLEPSALVDLLRLAWERLQAGGLLILETRNRAGLPIDAAPGSIHSATSWPLHPRVLGFFLQQAGFVVARTSFRGNADPLPRIPHPEDERDHLFNQAMERLDGRLSCWQDYSIVARRQ